MKSKLHLHLVDTINLKEQSAPGLSNGVDHYQPFISEVHYKRSKKIALSMLLNGRPLWVKIFDTFEDASASYKNWLRNLEYEVRHLYDSKFHAL